MTINWAHSDKKLAWLHRWDFLMLTSLLVLAMLTGLMSWLGIPASLVRAVTEGFACAVVAERVFRTGMRTLCVPALFVSPLLLAWTVGIVSGVINGRSFLETLLFTREILEPALFGVAFAVGVQEIRIRDQMLPVLLGLAGIQAVVALTKLVFVGVNEKGWIGTMHQDAGQLGLLMPLLGVGFVCAYALVRRRFLTAGLLAFLLGMFSIVMEKRAMMLLFPVFALGTLLLWLWAQRWRHHGDHRTASNSAARVIPAYLGTMACASVAIFVFSLLLIPSLDASSKKYETYGTDSVPAYIVEYLTRDYYSPMNASHSDVDDNPNIQMGRLRLLAAAMSLSLNGDPSSRWFGHGGGWLLEHRLLPEKGTDVVYSRVGLRGPSGMSLRHLFEIGWIGTAAIFLWFLVIIVALLKILQNTPNPILVFGAIMGMGVLVFDYLIYSEMSWNSGVFMPVLAFLVVEALRTGMAVRR